MTVPVLTDTVEHEQFNIPDDFIAKFSEDPLAQLLIVTDIGYYPRAVFHYCVRPQGSPSGILLYCTEGSGSYSIDGKDSRILNAGQLLIIPPDTPHEYGAIRENPWTIFWIHLKGFFFRIFYNTISANLPIRISDFYGAQIEAQFRQCFDLLKTSWQDEEFLYLCQLATTMLALLPCAAKQSMTQLSAGGIEGTERAIVYMREHLREMITLEQLVQASRFSSSHLHYLFKQSTGCAPVEYFLRLKIQAAAKDVYFSTLPIKDIAEAYGVEDPYYFSRLFKKIMGIAPAQYRKRIKG
ncbi:MAG: AraC family transcriptional regulator [Spirochaetaceae bacterium]|jgi:AraC-like DNA-binding protein|nr:AraC family transcriptional regulator [Spirochaetaceae bacterium]